MTRIGITGSYGGLNMGDEAILQVIVEQLRAAVKAEIVVFSANPADTTMRHDVDHALDPLDLSRDELKAEVKRMDLLVLGGGGILFDQWVRQHLREVQLAQDGGVPVFVWAIGVGPLDDPANREAVKACLERAVAVTVRDGGARMALEDIGLKRDVEVTADPGTLLTPEDLPKNALRCLGLSSGRLLIGMSVREPGPAAPDIDVGIYHHQLASAADYMVDRFGADIVFVPMEPTMHDVQHSHAVVSLMYRADRALVIKADYTSGQLLSLVGDFAFVVGMRLHFLIFAALQGVPFVALPYAPKVTGFVESLGMSMPPMEGLTTGRLIAHIDRTWDLRDDMRQLMDRGVPLLQERARKTADRVADLLRETVASDPRRPESRAASGGSE